MARQLFRLAALRRIGLLWFSASDLTSTETADALTLRPLGRLDRLLSPTLGSPDPFRVLDTHGPSYCSG